MRFSLKLITAATCIGVLPSCAARSLTGLERKPPILEADSARSVNAIATCLIKISDLPGAMPSFVPNDQGAAVTMTVSIPGLFSTGAIPMLYADIADRGATRHVRVSMPKTIWKRQNAARRAKLASCL